jgi:hypothetical protein
MASRLISANIANGELSLSFIDDTAAVPDLVTYSCDLDIDSNATTISGDLDRLARRLLYTAAQDYVASDKKPLKLDSGEPYGCCGGVGCLDCDDE